MEKRARTLSTFMAIALAATALAACSGTSGDDGASSSATAVGSAMTHGPRDAAQKAAVSTSAATASVQDHGGMKVVGNQPEREYLSDLMQNPGFADAYDDMDGTRGLPDWVRQGGTATPARTVTVGGRSLLMAQACKPHDCPGEQVVLLYDKTDTGMQGVFVRDPAPGTGAGVSDQAQFTWLGRPDEVTKAWLKKALTSR